MAPHLADPQVPEHMDVEPWAPLSRAGGTCQMERRPSVLPLPPAKRRRAITSVARQSSWQSCEMLGTEIDLGELWVRMLCFEEHWLSHDLELYSHRSPVGLRLGISWGKAISQAELRMHCETSGRRLAADGATCAEKAAATEVQTEEGLVTADAGSRQLLGRTVRKLKAQSVRFEDLQTSVQASEVYFKTAQRELMATCPLSSGAAGSRELFFLRSGLESRVPCWCAASPWPWLLLPHQRKARCRPASSCVQSLMRGLMQTGRSDFWTLTSGRPALVWHVVNASNLAAMDCSNMVLHNTGLSDLLQGDCVRSKAECGSAYCPNDWVSFEVDYSGQKVIKSECRVQAETECGVNCKSRKAGVCSTRSRADCAHGFEMTGSVGYLCKWNNGDGVSLVLHTGFLVVRPAEERLDSGHEKFTSEIETKCQEVDAELSKRAAESQQALSEISARLQDVESHGEAAARGLRALEPFIERVTSRLEDVEQLQPVVDNIRSELSAASQILRTTIAAEGKRAEESLQTLREDLISCQESDRLRLAKDLQEVRNLAEAASERAQELDAALVSGKEEESRALERLREEAVAANRNIQAVEARLHDLRSGTAANLQGSEQRLQDLFREALHAATDKAFAQDQVVSKRLESELHVQIGAVSAEIKELKSVSMDSSEKLRAVEQEFSTLAEKLERVKGQGISHQWKIPHCLRRLRYLSLLAEPGLWLDSDRFYLGGLGPLEMRLYAKGLRGGDGQCSLALRLPSEAAAKFALPMMVDLTVAAQTIRAGQTTDPEGSDCIIWLAESLGILEDHLADELADLSLAAELPLLPAPALLASCTSCPTLSPPGTRDDLCTLDGTEEAAVTDPLATLSSTSRARDMRGVAQVPTRANEAAPSAAGTGAPLPTLLGTTESQPSGVFALRSSWGASCTLPVSKASGPFDEQISPLGSLLGHGQRNPVAIPADDAAR
ncbi:unnamed protein product [Symbiodinium sp. CCMP2456]|nr:unnamed protein product [Symbiodinium sp. CCMP2456]